MPNYFWMMMFLDLKVVGGGKRETCTCINQTGGERVSLTALKEKVGKGEG